jgi:DNA-binding IscR family transcriptional regulator
MNKRQREEQDAKVAALKERLRQGDPLQSSSLSRSYGLPEPLVERILKEMKHA